MLSMCIVLIFILCILPSCFAGTSLLGAGGSGGGGGSMPKGLSFELDTMDKRKTKVIGPGLKVDLDKIELVTAGGTLRYTPTHIEFETGQSRWVTTMSASKVSFHHNDKAVVQLYAPGDNPYYHMSMQGNGGFRDLILDKNLGLPIVVNLCMIEKILTDLKSSSGGDTAFPSATDYLNTCKSSMGDTHQSVQQTLEWTTKLLMKSTSTQQDVNGEIATLLEVSLSESKKMTDDLLSRVEEQWNRQFTEEKEQQAVARGMITEELERQKGIIDGTPEAFNAYIMELNTTLMALIHQTTDESEQSLLSFNDTLELQFSRMSDYYVNLNREVNNKTIASLVQLNSSFESSSRRLRQNLENVTVVFSAMNTTLYSKLSNLTHTLDHTHVWMKAQRDEIRREFNHSMDERRDVMELNNGQMELSLKHQNSSLFSRLKYVNSSAFASLKDTENEITDRLSLLNTTMGKSITVLWLDLNATKLNLVKADSSLDGRLNASIVQWNNTVGAYSTKWNQSLTSVNSSLSNSLEKNSKLMSSSLTSLREQSFGNQTVQYKQFTKEIVKLWDILNTTIDTVSAANNSVTEELKLLRSNFSDQLEIMQSHQQTDNTATLLTLSLVNHTLYQWYVSACNQIDRVEEISLKHFEEIRNNSLEGRQIANERWEQNTVSLEMFNNSLVLGLQDNRDQLLNDSQQLTESLELMNITLEGQWLKLNNTLRDLLQVTETSILQEIQELASNSTSDVLSLNESLVLEAERLALDISEYQALTKAQFAELSVFVRKDVNSTHEHLEMLTNATTLHSALVDSLSVNTSSLESYLLDSANAMLGNLADINSTIMDLVQGNHGSLTKDLESVEDRLKDLDELVHGSVRSAWIELNTSHQISSQKFLHVSDDVIALEASIAQFEDRIFHMDSNVSSIDFRLSSLFSDYYTQTRAIVHELEDQRNNHSNLFSQHNLALVKLKDDCLSQVELAKYFGNMSVSLLSGASLQIRHAEQVATSADVMVHNVSSSVLALADRVEEFASNSQMAFEHESKLNIDRFDGLTTAQKESSNNVEVALMETKSLNSLYKELRDKTDVISDLNSTLISLNSDYNRRVQLVEDRELESSLTTRDLQQKLVVLETKSLQQDKQLEVLMQEKEKMKKEMATQDSVDSLRKLLVELQTSMVQQSSKVLEVVVASTLKSKV